MALSARQVSMALTLSGFGCWEALRTDQTCDEKHHLERSVSNLTLERDAYLREPRKFSASLKEVNNVITPFNFLVLRVVR